MALVATAACGGDDDGDGGDGDGGDTAAADTPIGQALTAELMSAAEGSPIGTEEEARCVAGGIVSGIGEDRLTELGVTPDSVGEIDDIAFNADEANEIVDAMFSCVDVKAALAEGFEAEFGAEGAQCLAHGLGDDRLGELMASSFLGGDVGGVLPGVPRHRGRLRPAARLTSSTRQPVVAGVASDQGSSSTLPVVARPSIARWASAASLSA